MSSLSAEKPTDSPRGRTPKIPFAYLRRNLWHFRLTVPPPVCTIIGKKELRYSLRTGYRSVAFRRAALLLERADAFFKTVLAGDKNMQANTPQQQIQTLLAQHLRAALNEHENWRGNVAVPLPETEIQHQVEAYDFLIKDTQSALARCDYERVTPAVRDLLTEGNIQVAEGSPEMRTACREYLKVDSEILRQERRRTLGDYSGEPLLPTPLPAAVPVASAQALAPAKIKPLKEVIEEWIGEYKEVSWSSKTASENESSLALLLEFTGGIDVAEFTFEQAREFKSMLSKLPSNRTKSKRFKNKSIKQILVMRNVTPMARRSANKYLHKASQFGAWAARHGYWQRNYFEAMTFPEKQRADKQRKAFEPTDLKTLFGSTGYTQQGFKFAFQYWVPLVGFYSGMRLDEICQLYLDDIVEEDGIPAISINTLKDKKLKNRASERTIPINPKLIELGFLEYVATLRERGQQRLFPELQKRRDGYGQKASRWFSEYRKSLGITDRQKVFHSFRHTYDTILSHQMTPTPILLQLMGHERGNSESEARYRKDFPPKIALEQIKDVDFGIDLSHLAGQWKYLLKS
jgi:integrase